MSKWMMSIMLAITTTLWLCGEIIHYFDVRLIEELKKEIRAKEMLIHEQKTLIRIYERIIDDEP